MAFQLRWCSMSKHSMTNDFNVKEVCLPLHTKPTTALEKPILSFIGVPKVNRDFGAKGPPFEVSGLADLKKIKLVDRSYKIRKVTIRMNKAFSLFITKRIKEREQWALLSYPKAADTRVGSQATMYNIIFRRTIFVNDVVRSSHDQLVCLQILLPNQILYAYPKCLQYNRIQLPCDQ
ncbi:hypothetical protein M9H77_13718 [Catharanthus roseus]|uniref:Uncharacterized protein n=1 Tax=Catharanthus roseus TaxID=4058 RepID=A0ACC0BKZ1_CATRO|nr:hypothetical protein M9H77_13718 [Catharanthus roseus]